MLGYLSKDTKVHIASNGIQVHCCYNITISVDRSKYLYALPDTYARSEVSRDGESGGETPSMAGLLHIHLLAVVVVVVFFVVVVAVVVFVFCCCFIVDVVADVLFFYLLFLLLMVLLPVL